jgi:hypothetical protein
MHSTPTGRRQGDGEAVHAVLQHDIVCLILGTHALRRGPLSRSALTPHECRNLGEGTRQR